jgi:DNA-binding MarR family transcriptional regulator
MPVTSTATEQRPVGRRPIGFWLKLVDRLIDDAFDAALGRAGVTCRHWQVLNLLQEGPASLQETDARLAPFLGGDQPTTRPVFDDLTARGWIAWTGDDRAGLTEAGRAAHADLRRQVGRSRARLAEGISPEEYAATLDVLRRMAVNLGWPEPA